MPGSLRFAAVLLALASSLPALAASEEAQREGARALISQGTALYGKRAYREALAKFEAAYEVFPNPKILFNVGQTAAALGDDVKAANAFAQFLDETLEADELANQRNLARTQMGKLAGRLGRLRLEISPKAAEVRVDDVVLSRSTTFVTPGRHAVVVRAEGYETRDESVEVRAAQDRKLEIALASKDVAAQAPVVVAVPAPAPTIAAAPAPDVATAPAAADLTPPSHEPPVGALDQPEPSALRHAVGWGFLGGAGLAFVASAAVGAVASSDNSTLAALVAGSTSTGVQPNQAGALRSTVAREAWISTGLTAVGVVAAGVGGYLSLTHGDSPAYRSGE